MSVQKNNSAVQEILTELPKDSITKSLGLDRDASTVIETGIKRLEGFMTSGSLTVEDKDRVRWKLEGALNRLKKGIQKYLSESIGDDPAKLKAFVERADRVLQNNNFRLSRDEKGNPDDPIGDVAKKVAGEIYHAVQQYKDNKIEAAVSSGRPR